MTPLAILSQSMRSMKAPTRTSRAGVYILIRKDKPIYVGSARDVEIRIAQHAMGSGSFTKAKRFDRVLWLPLPMREHAAYECALILALAPMANLQVPLDRGRSRRIIARLGLEFSPSAIADWRRRMSATRAANKRASKGAA